MRLGETPESFATEQQARQLLMQRTEQLVVFGVPDQGEMTPDKQHHADILAQTIRLIDHQVGTALESTGSYSAESTVWNQVIAGCLVGGLQSPYHQQRHPALARSLLAVTALVT